jgi:putative mRNA 3-end processing factor
VIVTHGSIAVMVRHLTGLGLQAGSFDTEYGDDGAEADPAATQEAS